MDKEIVGTVPRALLLDETVELLRKAIFHGRLRPGQRLNEAALAQQLGISRGPLREALRSLKERGLLKSEPHRGTFVADFTSQDVAETLTLRELLEPFAARAALSDPDLDLLPALQVAGRAMHAAARNDDAEGLAERHAQFHGAFYTHAGHRLLAVLWERLDVPVRLYVAVHRSSFGSLKDIAAQHDRMLHLAAAGDSAGLEREIQDHLRSNLASVIGRLERSEAESATRLLEHVAPESARRIGELVVGSAETEPKDD